MARRRLSPRAVLLCGLPGAGKTTTAKRLVAERGGVRLCPDDWMRALDLDLFDEAARVRVERLQWEMAEAILHTGSDVIIEWGMWTRTERDVVRVRCREIGVEVELRHLDPPFDELWERLDARNAQPGETVLDREDVLRWAADHFEVPTEEELALFDAPLR